LGAQSNLTPREAVVRRRIHGVEIEVLCDADDAAALVDRRLSFFPPGVGEPALSIEVVTVGVGGAADRPPDVRIVHESSNVSIVYSDRRDELWVDHRSGSFAHCHPAEGRARITVDRGNEAWPWIASRPLLTVSLLELLKRRSLFGVHAAAVAHSGRAVMLSGTTGSGKSTASLALLLGGWSFLGDDLVFLRSTSDDPPELLAFPDDIDASKNTLRFFPTLGSPADWPKLAGYPKHQLSPDAVRAGATVASAIPAVLLLPRVGDGDAHELEPVSPDELLLELIPNVILTETVAAQHQLDLLARLTREAPAFRLTLGRRLDSLPALLRELVEGGDQA
jgi:hypothetical protein